MSIGELIVYTQYVSMLIGPCISLIHFNTQIQQTKVSLDKIYDFEDYTILIKQDNYGVKIENTEKITIDFKNKLKNFVCTIKCRKLSKLVMPMNC